jgi:hypothetical protein
MTYPSLPDRFAYLDIRCIVVTSTPLGPNAPITHKNILSTLTPEELAQAQRQAILRQYSYVEGDPEDEPGHGGSRAGGVGIGGGKMSAEEKKAVEERRAMIQKALILDGKKKKFKKQQESESDSESLLCSARKSYRSCWIV